MATRINLQPFCDDEGAIRYDIGKPFVQSGFRYATDGRIIARTKTREHDTAGRKLPRDAASVYGPPIKSPLVALKRGKRYVEPEGGDLCGCECLRRCKKCDGSGVLPQFISYVGKALFDEKYLAKIERLPGVRVVKPKGGDDSMYFAFTGGDGVLMPLERAGALQFAKQIRKGTR